MVTIGRDTPFLDSLGCFFKYNLANGRRSIDAMPSIFAGIPAWMPCPLLLYQGNKLSPIPKLFADIGYETAFFHGGENGTMFFDVMADMFGFKHYFGSQEYPDKADHDGHWGIYDEPFLQFTVDKLREMDKPFFAGIFTLSSHQPYSIPAQYEDHFKKGSLDIHESIQCLKTALPAAKESYEDTLFIITADYTLGLSTLSSKA